MRLVFLRLVNSTLMFALAGTAFATPKVHRGPTSPRLFHPRPHSRPANHPAAARGIGSERATEIQTALIRSGYLSGAPTGVWDSPTQAAMQKLQADNGWQTKITPDSRAIIKLGLGSAANPAEHVGAAGTEAPELNPGTSFEVRSAPGSDD